MNRNNERIVRSFKAFVSCFLLLFYFSPNDSSSKTVENAFYFIEKPLFVLLKNFSSS